MTPGIHPIVAGNWKMNGTGASLGELRSIADGFKGDLGKLADAVICVPATLLWRAAEVLAGSPVRAGGEDCHPEESGAHTGDISAEMLRDAGASHVIVGHSERRTDHGETDELVRAKAIAAWRAGLVAIICIGETRNEREAGTTLAVLSRQIAGSVPPGATPDNTMVAYEPVWAIGTGRSATAEDATDVIRFIRKSVADQFDQQVANQVRILYGGSVKPDNIETFLQSGEIDGALVGGASLDSDSFARLVEAAARRGDLG